MAPYMVLHIAEFDRDFAADATDKVLLVAPCPFICSLDFEEMPSDTLLVLTDGVNTLLLNADHNTPVTPLRFRLLGDYFLPKARRPLILGLLVLDSFQSGGDDRKNG